LTSTDSNNPLAAAMEDVTFVPRLGFIQTGHDDLKQRFYFLIQYYMFE